MKGAPNETRPHSCRFASRALQTITPPEAPNDPYMVRTPGGIPEKQIRDKPVLSKQHFRRKKWYSVANFTFCRIIFKR